MNYRTDTEDELDLVKRVALENGADDAVLCTHWADGGEGATKLADAVVLACNNSSKFKLLYDANLPIKDKISLIAREMYGAGSVDLSPHVEEVIKQYTAQVC